MEDYWTPYTLNQMQNKFAWFHLYCDCFRMTETEQDSILNELFEICRALLEDESDLN